MKWTITAAGLIAALGLLAYTNPDMKHYDDFINREIMEQARQQNNPLVSTLGSLFGGVASNLVVRQTERRNFLFFSTYETALGKEQLKAVGVLNDFIITEKPRFLGER